MKTIAPILGALALFLTGCATGIKVPPGSLEYWHHTDTYGPFKDDVLVEGATKQADGSFHIAHYVGSAQWLGQGPTDEIRGLTVDKSGNPVAQPTAK